MVVSKFWLMRVRQFKIWYIFVPNPREIYLFVKKIAFLVNFKPIERYVSQKSDLTVKWHFL